MKYVWSAAFIVILCTVGVVGFAYSGLFDVAADKPHSDLVLRLVETVREHSIARRAKGIAVPRLDDAGLLASGGADYNEMCSGCHLRPGVASSEIRDALYPQPPDLTKTKRADPAQTFWIIKHGIKMSAMPAWGATHDDARMWAMVAFLQQLPRLTPQQYQILTARGDGDEEGEGHAHHHDKR